MLDIKLSRIINKPLDDVWSFVVDDFTRGHEWATGTTSCRAGTEAEPFDRICETESGTLRDTITMLDEENHVLEFTVEGLPFFVRSVVSTWTVRPVSATQAELTFGPRIETLPIIGAIFEIPMKKALDKLYPELFDDLVTFVETGEPSARKKQELLALAE